MRRSHLAAFGGHPHQSKIGSEEPIFDSFSLEGEAFGEKFRMVSLIGTGRTLDKASPLGEKLSEKVPKALFLTDVGHRRQAAAVQCSDFGCSYGELETVIDTASPAP